MDPRIAKAREVEAQQKTAAALAEIVPRLDRIERAIEQIRAARPDAPAALALTSLQAVEQQLAEVLEFLKRHTAEAGRNRK